MSTKHDADVIVAGAGPAGAIAARRLARGGRSRADRRALRVAATEAMRRRHQHARALTISISRRALTRIPTLPVSDLYLEGPSGDVFRMRSDGPAVLLIRRIEFDHLLVSLAVEAGARVLAPAAIAQARQDADGVTLTLRDGRDSRAPMVIAADGVNSVIARRLHSIPDGRRGHLALDMMEETPTDTLRAAEPETLAVFYGYGGAHGYAYMFPKRGHVNVGIGYLLSYFQEQIDDAPYDLQRRFVGDLRARHMMDGESRRDHFTPFLIPDRRAAEEDRRSTRAAGRRCRRIRQRLLGRGHLLRDGHRRARRLRHSSRPASDGVVAARARQRVDMCRVGAVKSERSFATRC